MPKTLELYAYLLVALVTTQQLTAQNPALTSAPPRSKFREINDSIVARFNRGDYKAIYQAGDDIYKGLNSEGELVGGLEWSKNNVGNIVSSELIEDLGKVEHFKWTGEKGVMKFELWLEGPAIRRYKFNTFIRQPGWPVRSIPSDNRLRTAMDSVVDKYATIYMSDPKAVGLSLGLYKGGRQYSYHYGEVEKGTGRIPDDRTIFSQGSISKTFIGVLLARAVTENKLSLQDDIRKYLPGDFPNLEYKGHPIRLIDLANHTSGINKFRFNNVPANFETMTPVEALKYFDSYTNEDLLRDLHSLTVDTVPGVRYHYSLGGINLLGMALAKVYHTNLDQLVREYYGKTFHMTDTKLISDPQDLTRYARGYDEKGQLMPQMPNYTVSLYTVKSTTKDMLNYVEANVLEKNPAIRLSDQQTWGDPKSFAVGLTWDMEDYYGRGLEIWHSGFDYGSITLLTAYPSLGFGMFLWANDDSRQGNLYDMERNIKENLEYIESQQQSVTITDLSPRFLAFYDSAGAASLDASERWNMWKRLYGFAAVPPTPFGDTLARRLLDSAWRRYPDSLQRIRKGVASFGVDPNVELERVVSLLGCGQNTRVRLIGFVGGFEDNAFAFSTDGVPTVAIPIEYGDARKSMIHEFTHAVHRSSGCADFKSGYGQSLGELVISEGVAMRVVEALVPGRPEYSYVAHKQEWLDTARARSAAILNGIRDHVADMGAGAVQRFTFGQGTTGLSREAYYAGWDIVGKLLRSGMSFHDIATTPPARFPALIEQAVASLQSRSPR